MFEQKPDFVEIPVGTVINGTYEVVKNVGFGHTNSESDYLCKHKITGKQVVLKCTYPKSQIDTLRNSHEAKCMSRVSHPNVLTVFDIGVTPDGMNYLVTEYIEAELLSAILKRETVLPLDRFAKIFGQACEALSAVHACKLVHRDVCPDNFLIAHDDRLSLTGFRYALDLSQTGNGHASQFVGNPAYISPEGCLGQTVDQRSDIYSLGCCMFEAIAGVSAFKAATIIDTMSRQISEHPKLPIDKRPEFAGLEYVVVRCLEKKPEERFQSAADLKTALVGKAVVHKPSANLRGTGKSKWWKF